MSVHGPTPSDAPRLIGGRLVDENASSGRSKLRSIAYDCRHDSLVFLASLIEGWPASRGAHPWSPSQHDFAPQIIARLSHLALECPMSVYELRNW